MNLQRQCEERVEFLLKYEKHWLEYYEFSHSYYKAYPKKIDAPSDILYSVTDIEYDHIHHLLKDSWDFIQSLCQHLSVSLTDRSYFSFTPYHIQYERDISYLRYLTDLCLMLSTRLRQYCGLSQLAALEVNGYIDHQFISLVQNKWIEFSKKYKSYLKHGKEQQPHPALKTVEKDFELVYDMSTNYSIDNETAAEEVHSILLNELKEEQYSAHTVARWYACACAALANVDAWICHFCSRCDEDNLLYEDGYQNSIYEICPAVYQLDYLRFCHSEYARRIKNKLDSVSKRMQKYDSMSREQTLQKLYMEYEIKLFNCTIGKILDECRDNYEEMWCRIAAYPVSYDELKEFFSHQFVLDYLGQIQIEEMQRMETEPTNIIFDGNRGGISDRSQFWLLLLACQARGKSFASIPCFIDWVFDNLDTNGLNKTECLNSTSDKLKSTSYGAVKSQKDMKEFINIIAKQPAPRAKLQKIAEKVFVALKDII